MGWISDVGGLQQFIYAVCFTISAINESILLKRYLYSNYRSNLSFELRPNDKSGKKASAVSNLTTPK